MMHGNGETLVKIRTNASHTVTEVSNIQKLILSSRLMKKDKRVAIVQSNYIPWRGYFGLMESVDEFILFDCVQYTRRDWRNRNRIKTPQGSQWLTIPVKSKGNYFQAIKDVEVDGSSWTKNHWMSIYHNYAKAPFFKEYEQQFEKMYSSANFRFLSEVNYHFLRSLNELLGIKTKLTWSSNYGVIEGKTERLVDLCIKVGATRYLSGPSAQSYIDPKAFADAEISLEWANYSPLPQYEQVYPPFDPFVSIIDLILQKGAESKSFMKIEIEAFKTMTNTK